MREVSGDYTVQYNSRSHLGVIFQRHGSVWPRVLPSCIANVLLTLLCRYYIYPWMEDEGLAVSGQGHDKSNFIISFFVVSRCTMALKRNTDAHANLFMMTQATRELISSITVATGRDRSDSAKSWRNKVSYYACLLLRMSMASVDYEGDECPAPWSVPELHGDIKEKLIKYNHISGDMDKYAHETRSLREEIYRSPVTMAYFLRLAIADHSTQLVDAVLCNERIKTLNSIVDKFLDGYLGQIRMRVFPPPFGLLQMARTMLFLWVLTLPLATQADATGSPFVHCFTVFFLTYAFLGLEALSIDLENPFGTDANDVDNLGVAKIIFEDIYAMLDITDGADWAYILRAKMSGKHGDKMMIRSPMEEDPLITVPLYHSCSTSVETYRSDLWDSSSEH